MQRSPAGGTYWLRPCRGPRRHPGREVQRASPQCRLAPRLPHTFLEYRRGLPNEPQDGALAPGGLCRAQASVALFQFGVRSFADDPSLSGGILVGSAVPLLRSPEIHSPTLASALPCPARGRTGEGVLGWVGSVCVCVCAFYCQMSCIGSFNIFVGD